MKYFLDTEFIEGKQWSRWSLIPKTTKPTIDLISIGVVAEDGREYYAISKDFNLKGAWNRYDLKPDIDNGGMKKVYWIRENVLKPIHKEFLNPVMDSVDNDYREFTFKNLKKLLNKYGKSNNKIAEETKEFTNPELFLHNISESNLEFYGYYSDYDWVVFCWLFGRMIDLPKGFPMFAFDLKQTLDEKVPSISNEKLFQIKTDGLDKTIIEHGANLETKLRIIKESENYPKQANKHNALADAKWNFELYKFLQTL